MSSTDNKQLIKQIFYDIFENPNAPDNIYEAYFSPDYVQFVDGKTLDYNHFVSHMKVLRATLQSAQITFRYIVAEGDTVATCHVVQAVKKDGSAIESQVIAFFKFKAGKLVLCDELTRLIKGEKSDADLGSRHQ